MTVPVTEEKKLPESIPPVQDKPPESPPGEFIDENIVFKNEKEMVDWRKYKEARRKDKAEMEEQRKRSQEKDKEVSALRAAMESLLDKPKTQSSSDEHQEETDEQRIAKLVREEIQKDRQIEAKKREEQELKDLPINVRRNLSDFDQVCSQTNIDYLEYHYPEIFRAFQHMPDSMEKYSSVYKAIKKLIPNTNTRKEEARVEKNLSKPQSLSSPGMTSTGDQAPNNLTEQRRKDNWERMNRVLRGGK